MFVWPRYSNKDEFHSWMLLFYLDEEEFNKEVMSWPGVKRNPRKSGMHYAFPIGLLKNKGQEVGVGLSSFTMTQKKEYPP